MWIFKNKKWLQSQQLFESCFHMSLPHPQRLIDFKDYRMINFIPELDIFDNKLAISPDLILSSLDSMIYILIDYDLNERALPLIWLGNYIATDIVVSVPFAIKFRIHKVIALSNLGYINEALQIYFQVIENKDKIISGRKSNCNFL